MLFVLLHSGLFLHVHDNKIYITIYAWSFDFLDCKVALFLFGKSDFVSELVGFC